MSESEKNFLGLLFFAYIVSSIFAWGWAGLCVTSGSVLFATIFLKAWEAKP